MNQNYIYVFPTSKNSCLVVLYYRDITNMNDRNICRMKDMIGFHRIHGYIGKCCDCAIPRYNAMWYECDIEFYNSMKRTPTCETLREFFARRGFDLVFEYPFKKVTTND